MRLVLDASVAIKFYVPEASSERALDWLTRDLDFSVPDIFLVEVAQALLRHCRERRLTREDLDLAVGDLDQLVDVAVSSGDLIGRALSIAHDLDHRLHDCMYLALADRLGSPLLTADERLVRKVRERASDLRILSLHDPHP